METRTRTHRPRLGGLVWALAWTLLLASCGGGGGGGGGGDGGGGASPPTTPTPPNVLRLLPNAATGIGTVTCSVQSGTFAACAASYPAGTALVLRATAGTGSAFTGWLDGTAGAAGCNGTVGDCAITLTADSTVRPAFTLTAASPSVTATTASANGGGGAVGCSANGGPSGPCGSYAPGTQVTLTAQPNAASNFTGWSGGGCSGTAGCTLTLTSSVVVTANFSRPTLNVQISGSGRVISNPAGIDCTSACVAVFDKTQQVTLTAVGTVFAGWTSGGCTGTGPCVLTLDQGAFVVAAFLPTPQPRFAPQAPLVPPNTSALFGTSIALAGDTLAVGSPGDDSNAGAVFVYARTNGVWTQQAIVKASNAEAGDRFGVSVALSGDTLVVGAPNEDGAAIGVNGNQADNSAFASGAAYVYTRSASVWSQQAYLKAANTGAGDEFGNSVAIAGDTVVVGAHLEAGGATGVNGNGADNSKASSGAAYVFSRNGTAWTQTAYLKASNTGTSDEFGYSVAISGSTIAVGAYHEGNFATGVNGTITGAAAGSGAVYVYISTGGVWSQQAYVKASNTRSLASFGWSVTLSGDSLAVGAPKESNFGSGVGANQNVTGGADSGAVYVFTRTGSAWSQQVYIKALFPDLFDNFGWSVALASDILAVGSPFEDSNATGANGDQRNNNVSNGGAAFVFRRAGTTWSQVDYLKSANTVPAGVFGNSLALTADTLAAGASGEFRGAAYAFLAP